MTRQGALSASGSLPAIGSMRRDVLLRLRVCDLKLSLDHPRSAWLKRQVQSLYRDLDAAGLEHFKPDVYLGDEWFSPEGVPAIAVPFFLAHPRLVALEKSFMTLAEGETWTWCRMLLRHEAGHAFDHAYEVSKTLKWRQIFGSPSARYRPDVYVANPDSRDFVKHLPDDYAQSHPDEDFAETFAVVIDPRSDWRERYRNWPKAYAKCAFVAELIKQHRSRRPRVATGPRCYAAQSLRSTLSTYYARRVDERSQAVRAVKKLAAKRRLPTVPELG